MRSLLFAWIVFSGLALIVLNASVAMAWIAIRRHAELLEQIAATLRRVDRQSSGSSEDEWTELQERLQVQRSRADRENGA